MVGHIAQTGQIVATDFRAGNYDEINQTQLEQLKQRYRIDTVLSFPIDEQTIKTAI
jgi:hypothetical protein